MSPPLFAGRNLTLLLEDEALGGLDAVNRALGPYRSALWKLAARGHYASTHEPVRERSQRLDPISQPAIPSITDGPYTLSFARGGDDDLVFLLSFPGARGAKYPIKGYPAISEFRAMLSALVPDHAMRSWSGQYFFGYTAEPPEKAREYWFRAHANGVTFGFSEQEWQSVRALVHRAWESPDICMAWDALALEYGEL